MPADVKQVYRLVGAKSKDERGAVDTVLEEFFTKIEAGWSQSRCDFEIGKCAEGQSGREERTANEAARVKRHREERAELFEKLRATGVHAPWNIGIEALRELVAVTTLTPLPVTAPVTPATASPSPNHPITPSPNHPITPSPNHPITPSPITSYSENSASESPPTSTPSGRVCARLRKAGIQGVNPSNPKLLALLTAGIPEAEFGDLADEQGARGKSLVWILAAVEGRRRDAAAAGAVPIVAKEWHETASGIEAKAVELGITKRFDEGFPAFKDRVFDAAGVSRALAA